MNDTPPPLFDPIARARARARAERFDDSGDFLRREVADRMLERLADINRPFLTRIDLGGRMRDPAFRTVPLTETLDLATGEADLITSVLDLHAVNDPLGILIQASRALKPDGFLLFSLFGGDSLSELRAALLEAESSLSGGAAQRVFPMADVRDMGSLLQRAGLALPVADVDRITVTYDHPLKLMADLRAMGEINSLQARSRKPLRRDVLARACEIYQSRHGQPDGRIPATFDILYLAGWRPHPGQQKPAKRGSGQVGLAEALIAAQRGEKKIK